MHLGQVKKKLISHQEIKPESSEAPCKFRKFLVHHITTQRFNIDTRNGHIWKKSPFSRPFHCWYLQFLCKNVGKYAKNQSEETIPTECIEGLRFKIGAVFRVGSWIYSFHQKKLGLKNMAVWYLPVCSFLLCATSWFSSCTQEGYSETDTIHREVAWRE